MLIVENLYKSYLPKGEVVISGCGTSLIEKITERGTEKDQAFAVNGISFTLKKNTILAMLGENGSGKSTLLKLLAGLLDPDAGYILLNSKKITGPSKQLVAGHPNIKLIHQNYNLFPNISLAENILYALRFHAKDYQQHRLSEMLDLCNLEEVKNKLPRNASGGEQQRAAIATALATDTDILLLDEPFSNLDVFNKNEMKEHIKKIAAKGNVGILFVTHDAQDALSVSDKVIVIKNGGIIQSGSPDKLYFSPVNLYAANITGVNNVLETGKLRALFENSLQEVFTGIKNRQLCAIRPEFIKQTNATEDSIHAVVKSCIFCGFYYLVKVMAAQKLSFSFYSPHTLQAGDSITLTIDFTKLHIFPAYRFTEVPFGSAAYKETVRLRYNVLRKPLGLSFSTQELTQEKSQHHLALYDGHSLLGCLCLVATEDNTMKMRQISVNEEVIGNGVGTLLVREAENFARTKGIKTIVLHSRETAKGFYQALGYQTHGKKFEEIGISHVKMTKSLV